MRPQTANRWGTAIVLAIAVGAIVFRYMMGPQYVSAGETAKSRAVAYSCGYLAGVGATKERDFCATERANAVREGFGQ